MGRGVRSTRPLLACCLALALLASGLAVPGSVAAGLGTTDGGSGVDGGGSVGRAGSDGGGGARVPAGSRGRGASPAGDDGAEEIEVVSVTPVKATAKPGGPVGGGLSAVIGRFHPALVHFPIAWLVLLLLVELAMLVPRWGQGTDLGRWLAPLTLASFLPAAFAGFFRAAELAGKQAAAAPIAAHRDLALIAAGLVLGAVLIRLCRRNHLAGAHRALYLLLVGAALATLAVAGHLGGKLAHGQV